MLLGVVCIVVAAVGFAVAFALSVCLVKYIKSEMRDSDVASETETYGV